MPILARPSLVEQVERMLVSSHVLLEAPTGYGKTVLLQLLCQHLPNTYALRLTLADIDLPALQVRLAHLLNPKHTLLLDDVHVLEESPEACTWLSAQLENTRPRWLLAGQRVPRDFSGLLVSDRLTRLQATDLAFSIDETRAVLGDLATREMDSASLVHKLLEGWPLGVSLVARMPRGTSALPAAKEHLFEYLAQRMYNGLPPALQRFLTVTAMPLRFDDALAEHLLGEPAAAARREVQRRNLFLYQDEAAGWFRYHDLIREFLVGTAGGEASSLCARCVSWFSAKGDTEDAIEHALAGRLYGRAADLMAALPYEDIYRQGRALTYRRWVLALPSAERQRCPILTVRLGFYLSVLLGEYREAGLQYLHAGMATAEAAGDAAALREARRHLALAYTYSGEYERALQVLEPLHDDPAIQGLERLWTLRSQANALSYLGRLSEAKTLYEGAVALAYELGRAKDALIDGVNLCGLVLLPRGDFAAALPLLTAADDGLRQDPLMHLVTSLNLADANIFRGDWSSLRVFNSRSEELIGRIEAGYPMLQAIIDWDKTMAALGAGQLEDAAACLSRAQNFDELHRNPSIVTLVAQSQAWLLRRQGRPAEAVAVADRALNTPHTLPYFLGVLALERDVAAAEAALREDTPTRFALSDTARRLIQVHARADLVRLRMLLAVMCWHTGNPRWRRHFTAALCAGRLPGYQLLLTQRDPDLALRFWRIALIEGLANDETCTALAAIGQAQPLLGVLKQPRPAARARAAAALAAIGDKAAMQALAEALEAETEAAARAALQSALDRLEGLPPPLVEVRLMGSFRLSRGGEDIPAESFPRPVVLRLFQYFALHRGEALTRERLLEDLWPDTPPDSAFSTFRTVHSRLRKVLEPYMRPKGPSRYFSVEGDAYRFDPGGYVTVDAERCRGTVRKTLDASRRSTVPPLPLEFLAALEAWRPLLPELAAEEWLLAPRQRLEEAYVEGCLYAAQSHLQRGDPTPAGEWAQRVVAQAPWLEDGYQALMRAHARQGQRSRALKVYEQAEAALARELSVSPSPVTRWLRERLERGEEI